MQTNQLPAYDMSDSPTGCCPRFNSGIWDDQELHLKDKLFVKAETKSAMHIPLNMGRVFERVQKHLDTGELIELSLGESPDPENYIAWKVSNKGRGLQALTKLLLVEMT